MTKALALKIGAAYAAAVVALHYAANYALDPKYAGVVQRLVQKLLGAG